MLDIWPSLPALIGKSFDLTNQNGYINFGFGAKDKKIKVVICIVIFFSVALNFSLLVIDIDKGSIFSSVCEWFYRSIIRI